MKIDPGTLPSGFTGSGLVAAYFSDETGTWEFRSGVYNSDTQEFTFSISHFTVYVVLASLGATPTSTPTSTAVGGTSLIWLWVVLGVVLVVGIIFLLVGRRRKTKQPQEK